MAFANLAKATRPGGRLVMLVWRGIEDNEWLREFFGAIGRVLPMPPPPADAPGPFTLSDPDRVRDLLNGAGWADVVFAAHDEPMWFGPDADTATTFMVGQMQWLFEKLDDARQAAGRGEPSPGDGHACGQGWRAPRVRRLDRHRAPLRTQGRLTARHHRHPTAAALAALARLGAHAGRRVRLAAMGRCWLNAGRRVERKHTAVGESSRSLLPA